MEREMDVWERNLSQKYGMEKKPQWFWAHGKVDEEMLVTTFDN
jgi:hypothetical protein